MILFTLLFSILQNSLPLVFAAFGGLFSERSGVINIALEGMLTIGAFVAVLVALSTGSAWAGLLAGGASGALLGMIYGWVVVYARADQIVSGTAFNLFIMGLIPLVMKKIYDSTGSTPALTQDISLHHYPLLVAFFVVVACFYIMNRSVLGQWISFAGECPSAVRASGLNVNKIRFFSVLVSGWLTGLGGAMLSLYLSSGYSRNMVAGRGFIALAALIFGKWRVLPALGACLFFGALEAMETYAQGMNLWPLNAIPSALLQAAPYAITLVVLAGFVGRAKAPSAIGT